MSELYTTVPASILHVKNLAAELRPASCLALKAFGKDARTALREAFLSSAFCRTALIDGKPAAMWGAQAPLLSDSATVWLAMSDLATKWPLAVVRKARAELAQMSGQFGELRATVGMVDNRAILFARTLGFVPYEIIDGEGRVTIMRYEGGKWA